MITLCSCGAVVRVLGDPLAVERLLGPGSDYFPNSYTCPRCQGKHAVCVERPTPEMLMGKLGEYLFEVPVEDAFRLQTGMGLPEECRVDAAAVNEVLGNGVTGWELETDEQSGRPYLKTLVVTDGRTLHFGAGPLGAVIYRIARKPRLPDEASVAVQP